MTDRDGRDNGEKARRVAPRLKEAVWKLPDGVRLSWKRFDARDAEVIVFNAFSGQTHLLDSFSAAVLEEIAETAGSVAALATRIARRFGLDDDARLRERVSAALAEFDRQGLADPIPSQQPGS